MKVRMLVHVSGGRGDGAEWPRVGEVLDVDDVEGAHLCAARMAIPVRDEPEPEKAVMPDTDVESRAAESPAEAPGPVPPGKPGVNAPKADWVAYAAAQGLPDAEAAGLSKSELITRYGG